MSGIVVSPGIAMGKAKRIETYVALGLEKTNDVDKEVVQLEKSLEDMLLKLEHLKEKTSEVLGEEEAEIFEAHKMILMDPTLMPQIIAEIKTDEITAASAVELVLKKMEDVFSSLDSDYMKERALDIYDIKKRWVNLLKGVVCLEDLDEPVILIAEELTPSDTLDMNLDFVAGLVMEKGGKTSHTAILAQSMGIPAVVGYGKIDIPSDTFLVLDADKGMLVDRFDETSLEVYYEKREGYLQEKELLKKYLERPSVTLDKKYVEIAGNIAGLKDLKDLNNYNVDGVGLFRTEFIYMNRKTPPSEEEQYEIYKKIVLLMDHKPIIFRTMDIGGDKEVPYLNLPSEHNPFLGYRAIRYCLDHVEFFKSQIKAILRASAHGKIKIMFPMIGSVAEFLKAKEVVVECMKTLKTKAIDFDEAIEIGIMVEIPSAAISIKNFTKHVDFVSIGTNDLTQYTLAVDRQSEYVSDLYDYFDPSVLNLIHHVIKVGKETNTWVGMCGSAAGDPLLIPLLVKWGIDEISMSSSQIPKAKSIVCEMTSKEDITLTEKILSLEDGKAVRKLLESL